MEVTREQWEAWVKAGCDPATCPSTLDELRIVDLPIRMLVVKPFHFGPKILSEMYEGVFPDPHYIKINSRARVYKAGDKVTEVVKHSALCSWHEDHTTCNCVLKDFIS